MDVRTMTTDDLDDALALWERTELIGTVPPAEVEGVLAHDPDLVLVAEDDAGLVGAVIGTYDGRRGWIQRLAVDPTRRHDGVGRRLVGELERRLADRGCVQINLLVYGDNAGGRSFWEQVGYDGSDDVVLYRRRLDGGRPPGERAAGRTTDC